MAYEPYTCNLDSETNTTLKIYLFKDVQNIEEIRSNVINGSWKCAVIKPSLIIDVFQIVVAANKAVIAEKRKNMVTRTVYSEILFNLSPSKNISQSMSKFGLETDDSLLVCFLVIDDSAECEITIQQIKGELCPIADLENFTNMKELKNVYKLNNLKSDNKMLDVIVSKIVTKNFITQ